MFTRKKEQFLKHQFSVTNDQMTDLRRNRLSNVKRELESHIAKNGASADKLEEYANKLLPLALDPLQMVAIRQELVNSYTYGIGQYLANKGDVKGLRDFLKSKDAIEILDSKQNRYLKGFIPTSGDGVGINKKMINGIFYGSVENRVRNLSVYKDDPSLRGAKPVFELIDSTLKSGVLTEDSIDNILDFSDDIIEKNFDPQSALLVTNKIHDLLRDAKKRQVDDPVEWNKINKDSVIHTYGRVMTNDEIDTNMEILINDASAVNLTSNLSGNSNLSESDKSLATLKEIEGKIPHKKLMTGYMGSILRLPEESLPNSFIKDLKNPNVSSHSKRAYSAMGLDNSRDILILSGFREKDLAALTNEQQHLVTSTVLAVAGSRLQSELVPIKQTPQICIMILKMTYWIICKMLQKSIKNI